MITELFNSDNFKQVTDLKLDKDVAGVYYGDMLSWVMSHAKENEAWVTIQTHVNIVAVASLLNLSCVIIPEGVEIDQETIDKANATNIPILSTELNAYEIFKHFYITSNTRTTV